MTEALKPCPAGHNVETLSARYLNGRNEEEKEMKIPKHLREEFMSYMEAHDNDDLPDGAWFCVLENAGEQFLQEHKPKGDGNDAAHLYLEWSQPK